MKFILKKIIPSFLWEFIKNIFYLIQRYQYSKISNDISANFKNVVYNHKFNILSELCEKYGSDKGFIDHNSKKPYKWKPHTYTSYYHSIFNLSRNNIKNVFECGLGTNNPNFKSNMTIDGVPGASLRVWRDYFINAKIYGADIDKEILFEEERIKTFYVDQLNTNSIKNLWNSIKINDFDIIIDDGLHEPEANYNFFINSFQKLKANGVYIIEDVPNQYLLDLQNKLIDYDTDIITLFSKYKKNYIQNNLIVIRKS